METNEKRKPSPEKSILTEAAEIVAGARRQDYGTPRQNHSRTAALVNAYLATVEESEGGLSDIDAFDVCMLNILQKISRLTHRRTRDSLVDIAGYAANAAEILDAEQQINAVLSGAVEQLKAPSPLLAGLKWKEAPPGPHVVDVKTEPPTILDVLRKNGRTTEGD